MAEKVKFTTPEGRLSYPALFKPRGPEEYDPGKFVATILIPKKNRETLKPIEDAIKAMTLEIWGPKAPKFKFPAITDGDEKEDPNYHGNIALTAKTTLKPALYKPSRGEYVKVETQDDMYPGCWVKLSVHLHPYGPGAPKAKPAQKFIGISLSLNAVVFIRHDDPFVSRSNPIEDFGAPPEDIGGEIEEVPF